MAEIAQRPYFEAKPGTTPKEVVDFLVRRDLPGDLYLDWSGGVYHFRTEDERLWFAQGIKVILKLPTPGME